MGLKPEGYIFELATAVLTDKSVDDPERYTNWGKPQFSFTEPCVPEGSIRNLRAVYSAEATEIKFVVDGKAALNEIGKVAAKLQEGVDTIRREVLEEVIVDLEARRKGGFWANGDANGNHIRDQSFIRAICAVRELKGKRHNV